MKKLSIIILSLVLLALVLSTAALAAWDDYVVDEAGVLTQTQIDELNQKAAALSAKRKCGVYLRIAYLIPDGYSDVGYARFLIKEFNLGYGGKSNCVLLLMETGEAQGQNVLYLHASGKCSDTFSDDVCDRIQDDIIVPMYRTNDFYQLAVDYMDEVDRVFENTKPPILGKLAVVILVPCFIAFLFCAYWKSKMKTAKLARDADSYIPQGGFVLTAKSDTFLYRNTTRTKISSDSNNSSSGSSGSSRRA